MLTSTLASLSRKKKKEKAHKISNLPGPFFGLILRGHVQVFGLGVLAAAFLLLINPVRHSFESPLCVGHHVLDCLQFLLGWINGRMLCHHVAIIVHKNSQWTLEVLKLS